MKTSAGIKMESSYSSLSHTMSDIYTITFTYFTSNILIQTHSTPTSMGTIYM